MGTAEEEMKRMEEEAQRRQAEALKNPDILAGKKDPVGDLKNLSDAVNRDDSLIGERSKVLEEEQMQPAAPEAQQETPGAEPTREEVSNTPEPVAAPNIPNRSSNDEMYLGAKAFEGKGKNFFSPSTEKGFWQMLDKKMEDILNSKDPQEMMEKAFWAILNLVFDTINAELDHHKAEKARLKKEYQENTQAYDRERGTKESDMYVEGFKSILGQLPAEYQQYNRDGHFHFEDMPSKDKKKLGKLLVKDPKLSEQMRQGMSRFAGREIKKDECKGMIGKFTQNVKSAIDLNRARGVVAKAAQGKTLKDPAVSATVEIGSSIRGEAESVDADARSFSERVASHTADRQAYEQARSGRTSPETGRPFVRGRGNEGNAA